MSITTVIWLPATVVLITKSFLLFQYRREFADPFWNSQKEGLLMYVFALMTSWAMVCEVYYLKPTTIQVCSHSTHSRSPNRGHSRSNKHGTDSFTTNYSSE